jgi:SulP family sulfate permease
MRQASSYTPLDPIAAAGAGGRGLHVLGLGAIEGAAFTVPLSLGSVTLLFSRIGPDALAAGVFATLLSLAWLHLMCVGARRPVLYSARFFEATTLAAMIDQMVRLLPSWSVPDTQGVRLALLCLVVAGAGLAVAVLYVVRADRFSRFIPTPVFAGFSTSIALVILFSQAQTLRGMLSSGPAVAVLVIAGAALAVNVMVRLWAPRWPGAATALVLGLGVGLVWLAAGRDVPMLGTPGLEMRLPVMLADFRALAAPGVAWTAMAPVLLANAAVLGAMVFINTTMSAQLLTHADDRAPEGRRALVWSAVWMAVLGLAGSAPLSGSIQSSSAATRHARLGAWSLAFTAAILGAVALSGVAAWIPLAAVVGALLAEAWFMVDRPSVRVLVRWLRRQPVDGHAKEDLALVVGVTAVAVTVNMVAAVFAGLLLGLLMFAVRNARRPVRQVLTGRQISSNCARPRADVRLLAHHGERLRIAEFERDLFFGSVAGLERTLHAQCEGCDCLVLDWSRVRSLDSSAAQAAGKFERAAAARGLAVFHVEPAAGSPARSALAQYLPKRRGAADLDHALELAENEVLARHAPGGPAEATVTMEAASLFQGLDESQRARLQAVMPQRMLARGTSLVGQGDESGELLLILQGSGSVLVAGRDGTDVRIAGVRRGSTVGEMGFLDGSSRSASVVADEDTWVAALARADFDALGREDPALARQLLANLALDMATRLRYSNRAATARHASG